MWMRSDDAEVNDEIDFDVTAVCDDVDDEDDAGGPKWSTPLPKPQNQKKFQSKGSGMASSIPQENDGDEKVEGKQFFVSDGQRLEVEQQVVMGD